MQIKCRRMLDMVNLFHLGAAIGDEMPVELPNSADDSQFISSPRKCLIVEPAEFSRRGCAGYDAIGAALRCFAACSPAPIPVRAVASGRARRLWRLGAG